MIEIQTVAALRKVPFVNNKFADNKTVHIDVLNASAESSDEFTVSVVCDTDIGEQRFGGKTVLQTLITVGVIAPTFADVMGFRQSIIKDWHGQPHKLVDVVNQLQSTYPELSNSQIQALISQIFELKFVSSVNISPDEGGLFQLNLSFTATHNLEN